VGDYCSTAMEQGFSDVCMPLCLNEKPSNKQYNACRAAAREMPRPTVRQWCEHGYSKGFQVTKDALRDHFSKEAAKDAEPARKLDEEPEAAAEKVCITTRYDTLFGQSVA
jgi:hypothetical protein